MLQMHSTPQTEDGKPVYKLIRPVTDAQHTTNREWQPCVLIDTSITDVQHTTQTEDGKPVVRSYGSRGT